MPGQHYVTQWIDIESIRQQQKRMGIPNLTIARLMPDADPDRRGFSESMVSLVLNEERCMSLRAQVAMMHVFEFLGQLHRKAQGTPIDFANADALRPLFAEWMRKRHPDSVVGLSSEDLDKVKK